MELNRDLAQKICEAEELSVLLEEKEQQLSQATQVNKDSHKMLLPQAVQCCRFCSGKTLTSLTCLQLCTSALVLLDAVENSVALTLGYCLFIYRHLKACANV